MSYRAIYVAALAAIGIACVSVDALAAHVAASGGTRAGAVGAQPWYNPNYSTGSYSPSYSTGGYYHAGFSVKFQYPHSDYSEYSTSSYDPGYAAGYYPSSDHTAAYCAHRFRSYDPGAGTYLSHDGRRHPCP